MAQPEALKLLRELQSKPDNKVGPAAPSKKPRNGHPKVPPGGGGGRR